MIELIIKESVYTCAKEKHALLIIDILCCINAVLREVCETIELAELNGVSNFLVHGDVFFMNFKFFFAVLKKISAY